MERTYSGSAARGFASDEEMVEMLRQVPQETAAQREAIHRWLTSNGSKDALMLLVGEHVAE